jgi:ComF family protein
VYPPLHNWLNELLPPRPTYRLTKNLTDEHLRQLVPRLTTTGAALLPFADPRVRALVHECKYHRNQHAAQLLATCLRQYLGALPVPHRVVPIPLSRWRRLARGYNQVTWVTTVAAAGLPHLVDTRSLRRVRHTTPQTKLKRADRRTNMAGAFRGRQPVPADLPILIIDDVTTTGATLEAAQAALAPYTKRPITTLALAH